MPVDFTKIQMQPQGQPFQPLGVKPKPLATNPDAFKSMIVGKYPDGADSEGKKYADIPARTLTAKIVQKFPDGVTSDGRKYSDFLTPTYIGEDLVKGVKNAGGQMFEQAKGGIKQFAGAINELTQQPTPSTQDIQAAYKGGGFPAAAAQTGAEIAQTGFHGVATLGKAVGGAGAVALAPLAPLLSVGTSIGNKIGNAVPEKTALQFSNFLDKNPEIEKNAQDLLNLSNLAVPEVGAKGTPLIAKARGVLPAIPESGGPFGAKLPSPGEVASIGDAKTSLKVKAVAKDWESPIRENKPTFNNAKAVLEKSPGTPQFIAEQGINPYTHIEDGKYVTSDTAEALRNTAGRMSRDTLRPSLEVADRTTPKTPISDVKVPEKLIQSQGRGVTPDDVEVIQGKIQSKLDALQRKYPNGMSLENMHDEKITYSQNGKFSPVKDPAVDNGAIANRAISSVLGDLVEKKAPPDVPVGDFNAYLQKYYKAADYLDALNSEKAPVTTGQSIARGVAKFGGAALARHLIPGGGELISSFAGYQIGKALEHAAENLTNPMRDSFLKNLKSTNPEAFEKVTTYLKNNKDVTPLLLPGRGQTSYREPTLYGTEAGKISLSPEEAADIAKVEMGLIKPPTSGKYPAPYKPIKPKIPEYDPYSKEGVIPFGKKPPKKPSKLPTIR